MNDIQEILQAARGRTITVLGDLMLDEWIMGDASRISPEAPVPVVRWSERKIAPGGAANVVMNLLSLGAKVLVSGVVGDDSSGHSLVQVMESASADTSGLVFDATRPTTMKTRVLALRQQMLRIDRESDEPFSEFDRDLLEERLQPLLEQSEVLCISDYDKGIVTCGAVGRAIEAMHAKGKRVTVGGKPQNVACYKGANLVTLNEKEASEAAGFRINNDEDAERAGTLVRERICTDAFAMTRSGKGVLLFEKENPPLVTAGHEVEVYDVAGAGDTFVSAATVALAAGADYPLACEFGNLAGAASVRHVGVVAVTPEEVLRIRDEP